MFCNPKIGTQNQYKSLCIDNFTTTQNMIRSTSRDKNMKVRKRRNLSKPLKYLHDPSQRGQLEPRDP